MGRLQIGAALLILIAPSYAWAAPPKGLLGATVPSARGAAPASRLAPKSVPRSGGPDVARFEAALTGLKPEGRSLTRGANESRVYQAASPSVVLVVSKSGLGSGAVISADGMIVTNLHVVGDEAQVGVVFKPKTEGQKVTEADVRIAKVVRRDEVADLALLKVAEIPPGVKPLALAGATAIEVGSDVHAIGHPTGEAWTYTRGIVSQIRKDYAWSADNKRSHTATVVQTQTPINPGNSGGPLIDDQLAIVGINSFKGPGEGMNYAVSAEDVKALLARTSDRVVQAAAKAKAEEDNCEVKAVDEEPTKDPVGVDVLMDTDCDGKGDMIMGIPDKKSEPYTFTLDGDGDGKFDTVIIDEGRDGNYDLALYDTDGDGKPDMQGEFRNGETEPYRMEKLEQ